MSPTDRAVRFTELVATAEPDPGNSLDQTIVESARKIAADLRRERERTSRSGIPLTRTQR